MLEALLERFRQGDRLALSRLISFLSRGEHREEILTAVLPPSRRSRVVAITGSAGVGKSTLVGKLIEIFRNRPASRSIPLSPLGGRGQGEGGTCTVAVLACDPKSPLTGGALLGDRFRMPARVDPGVFIRSLAAPGGKGAVAEHVGAIIHLLEAFGFDLILLETVGAGQGDTAVRDLADVVVLLVQPETSDDLQWEKAGVLEVADIIAIHKADLPGAAQAEAGVKSALGLSGAPAVPVLRVSAKTGEGPEELAEAILSSPLRRQQECTDGKALLALAQELLASWFDDLVAGGNKDLGELLARWKRREISAREAVLRLLRVLDRGCMN